MTDTVRNLAVTEPELAKRMRELRSVIEADINARGDFDRVADIDLTNAYGRYRIALERFEKEVLNHLHGRPFL